jgi:molecular chaperone GrpE (heat shock protein)
MPSKDSRDDLDQMLSSMDFGKMMDAAERVAGQNEKHRKETSDLLIRFLDVVDSLEALGKHCEELVARGCEHIPLRSVNTILGQALNVFSQVGVEQMKAVGQPLNLERQEVDSVISDSSVEEDTVLEEKVRGYLWNGSLLRRAKVVISR